MHDNCGARCGERDDGAEGHQLHLEWLCGSAQVFRALDFAIAPAGVATRCGSARHLTNVRAGTWFEA
jgi:hypothetical protein